MNSFAVLLMIRPLVTASSSGPGAIEAPALILRPVHHDEPRHARELAGVGGDEGGACTTRLRRYQNVVGADRPCAPPQLRANVGGLARVRRLERQQGDRAARKEQRELVLVGLAALAR